MILACVVGGLATHAYSQSLPKFGIGAKVSTLGIGIESADAGSGERIAGARLPNEGPMGSDAARSRLKARPIVANGDAMVMWSNYCRSL